MPSSEPHADTPRSARAEGAAFGVVRTHGAWVAAIAAVVGAVYASPLLTGAVFFRRDIFRFVHPVFAEVRARLAAGELPLWSPLKFGGAPLLADITYQLFYPPNLFVLWASPALAITLLIVGHHFWAALGGALLLRRWGCGPQVSAAAGLCFALSGYAVSMDDNLHYLFGLCWIPWLLWALDRLLEAASARRAAVVALVFACLFTSAELQLTYLSVMLSVSYVLLAMNGHRWRGLAWLSASGAMALGVVAVQLLPLASVVRASSRVGGVPVHQAQTWSFHPVRLLELVSVHPFGLLTEQTFWGHGLVNGGQPAPWAYGLYLTASVPVLAMLAPKGRRTWWLWGLTALALLLAMGAHFPLDRWFRAALPLWGAFRYPEKLVSLASLALCVAAGLGLTRLLGSRPPTWAHWVFVAGALVAGTYAVALWLRVPLALAPIDALLAAGGRDMPREDSIGSMSAATSRAAGLLCAAALLAYASIKRPSPWLHWAWPALLVIDLASANVRILDLAPADFYDTRPAAVDALLAEQEPEQPRRFARVSPRFRFPPEGKAEDFTLLHQYWLRETLAPNTLSDHGVMYAVGYSASESERFMSCWSAMAAVPDRRAIDLQAVGFVIDSMAKLAPAFSERDRVLGRYPEYDAQLLALHEPTSMARVVYDVRSVESDGAALEVLTHPGFDVRHAAVVEAAVPGLGATDASTPAMPAVPTVPTVPTVPATPARFIEFGGDEMALEVETPAAGWLVLASAHHPNWHATLDGEVVPIVRTNYFQQGIAMPAGKHRVRFSYRDRAFELGAVVSLLSLLGVLWALWRGGRAAALRDV